MPGCGRRHESGAQRGDEASPSSEFVALRHSPTTRPAPLSALAGRANATDDNATAVYWSIPCGDNSAA
ncbi:hypothetical protein [Streptomyces sp. R35]|uniref:Uncharacterized protein n=1 Tax=Streptomyces sp. R35 TaxID=3238630 RepID=A0AB39SL76_9ACTN